jgi:hypothetical protein
LIFVKNVRITKNSFLIVLIANWQRIEMKKIKEAVKDFIKALLDELVEIQTTDLFRHHWRG